MSSNLQVRVFEVPSNAWLPLQAANGCDYFSLWNSSGAIVWLRTDVDDEATEKQLAPGAQEIMLAPRAVSNSSPMYRFPPDDTIFFCRAAAGVARLEVTFIR